MGLKIWSAGQFLEKKWSMTLDGSVLIQSSSNITRMLISMTSGSVSKLGYVRSILGY